jgi:hypothetical protein
MSQNLFSKKQTEYPYEDSCKGNLFIHRQMKNHIYALFAEKNLTKKGILHAIFAFIRENDPIHAHLKAAIRNSKLEDSLKFIFSFILTISRFNAIFAQNVSKEKKD